MGLEWFCLGNTVNCNRVKGPKGDLGNLTPKDQQAHREQRVSRESNFDLWFAPSAVDPNDTNQVKNTYLYVKSIANGEFVGSIDV